MESDTPRITERGVATLPGEAWELARLPEQLRATFAKEQIPLKFLSH